MYLCVNIISKSQRGFIFFSVYFRLYMPLCSWSCLLIAIAKTLPALPLLREKRLLMDSQTFNPKTFSKFITVKLCVQLYVNTQLLSLIITAFFSKVNPKCLTHYCIYFVPRGQIDEALRNDDEVRLGVASLAAERALVYQQE